MEVEPAFWQSPDALAATSTCGRAGGAQVPLQRVHAATQPDDDAAGGQPPGPVPVGHAVVQPGPGRRARRRGRRDRGRRCAQIGLPATDPRQLPGHRPGLPGLARQPAAADPGRAGRRLHRARLLYESLHPPDHDPVDAAVGRRRRAAGAARSASTELTIIALIGIILLIGIVKKNAIMMIDFALEAERTPRADPPEDAIYRRACCASGRS